MEKLITYSSTPARISLRFGISPGSRLSRGAFGPTLPSAWALVGVGDFNGDGKPDYVFYNESSRQTAIWYLNNNVFVGGAYGPTLPGG